MEFEILMVYWNKKIESIFDFLYCFIFDFKSSVILILNNRIFIYSYNYIFVNLELKWEIREKNI